MANSIRDSLGREDIISAIVLSLPAENKNYVLVEGIGDQKLMRKFLDSDTVEIYEAPAGKPTLIDIVQYFNNDRVIGICDRDYETGTPQSNIFYYDFNSMEIMLIANDELLSSLLCENYRGDFDCKEVRNFIFNQLKCLSCLRQKSFEEDLDINFKNNRLSECFLGNEINRMRLFENIAQTNQRDISSFVCSTIDDCHKSFNEGEFYYFTCGHDFMTLLQKLCSSVCRRGGIISKENLESAARMSFTKEMFKDTVLYADLSAFNPRILAV